MLQSVHGRAIGLLLQLCSKNSLWPWQHMAAGLMEWRHWVWSRALSRHSASSFWRWEVFVDPIWTVDSPSACAAVAFVIAQYFVYVRHASNQIASIVCHPALVCRQADPDANTAEGGLVCNLKAAFFLLALLRQLAYQGVAADVVSSTLIWAYKCLTAPFAWGKSLQTALNDYDSDKAGASKIMTFAASLQFLDPQHLSGDLLTEKGEASTSPFHQTGKK